MPDNRSLITDGRISGGTSRLCIGHASPEAAEGELIGLVEKFDTIEIDIPNRSIHLGVDAAHWHGARQPWMRTVKMAGNPNVIESFPAL